MAVEAAVKWRAHYVVENSAPVEVLVKMSDLNKWIKQLEAVTIEIRRKSKELKDLRTEELKLKQSIISVMKEQHMDEIKTATLNITLNTKNSRSRTNLSVTRQKIGRVLETYGVDDSNKVADVILEQMRGELQTKEMITVTSTLHR